MTCHITRVTGCRHRFFLSLQDRFQVVKMGIIIYLDIQYLPRNDKEPMAMTHDLNMVSRDRDENKKIINSDASHNLSALLIFSI